MCVFFRGGVWSHQDPLFLMVSFIACTCPNRSAVGVIDNPVLLEQVFEQNYIPYVPEKKKILHRASEISKAKMFCTDFSEKKMMGPYTSFA